MRNITSLLIVVFLMACNKPVGRHYEITKVELARSGAWSDYGATLSIDTSLNYKYFGDIGVIKQSYFIGKISSNLWDTLNQKLEHIKYKALPTESYTNIQDVNYFELIVHWENGEKHIIRVWESPPDSVLSVIKWIDTSYRKVKLLHVKDTFKFESKYHLNWKPPIDRVYFPPPVFKRKKR
jgi:hypothetical protein